MMREPLSEDAFAVAEAPMLSSPHGSSISFLKMLWAETAGRAREQRQSAERGEDFFDRRVVDFEQKLAFGRAAKLFF